MSSAAKVYSSESIEAVRMALMSFMDQVSDALTELSAEMRRMQEWLEHDRPRHWKNQVRLGGDLVHEAQQALNRCLMFPIANERPSCTEERMALKKAKERLAYCEQKADRVRHWQKTVKHELFEYEGRMTQLVRLVEIEVPQAIGVLNRILRNLEEYNAIRARDPRTSYDDVSMARAIWDEGEDASEQEGDAAASEVNRDGESKARTAQGDQA
jgi:exonuclease VII large subunit